MYVEKDIWYFLQGYGGRTIKETLGTNQIRVFCRKTEYDALVLVTKEVLEKIRYEPEVVGFSTRSSLTQPYPLFAVGLDTDDIQPLINKYSVEAIRVGGASGAINYEHYNKHDKEWGNT